VTLYLAPLSQVQSLCGPSTLACYSPDDEVILATGDDVTGVATAKDIVTHEYGHHIANHQNDSQFHYPPHRNVFETGMKDRAQDCMTVPTRKQNGDPLRPQVSTSGSRRNRPS